MRLPDFGSGFCIFNDLYFAARQSLLRGQINRVLIIDCDVHQGDGTACLAKHDAQITTLSLHGEKNFPYRKQQSDFDFPLPSGCDDQLYLETLEQALALVFRYQEPDLILYDAGIDVHVQDDLGLLNISTHGVYQRDKMVLSLCHQKGIPVACVIGGGYQRNIDALCEVHLQLFKAAQEIFGQGGFT